MCRILNSPVMKQFSVETIFYLHKTSLNIVLNNVNFHKELELYRMDHNYNLKHNSMDQLGDT